MRISTKTYCPSSEHLPLSRLQVRDFYLVNEPGPVMTLSTVVMPDTTETQRSKFVLYTQDVVHYTALLVTLEVNSEQTRVKVVTTNSLWNWVCRTSFEEIYLCIQGNTAEISWIAIVTQSSVFCCSCYV